MNFYNDDAPRYFQWDDLYPPSTSNPGLIEDSGSNGSHSDYSGSPFPVHHQFATPSPVMEAETIPFPEPMGPYFDVQVINAKLPHLLAQLQDLAHQQTLYNIIQQLPSGIQLQDFNAMLVRRGKNYHCPFTDCQRPKGYDRSDRAVDHICTEHLGSRYQCPMPNCSSRAKRLYDIRVHIAKHFETATFQCHVCPQTFEKKGNLHRHLETVHQMQVERRQRRA